MRSLSWTARLFGVQAPAVHVLPKVDGDLTPLPLGEGTAAAGIAQAGESGLPVSAPLLRAGRSLPRRKRVAGSPLRRLSH